MHLALRSLQEQAFGITDLLFTPFPLEIPDLALVQVPRAGSCQYFLLISGLRFPFAFCLYFRPCFLREGCSSVTSPC